MKKIEKGVIPRWKTALTEAWRYETDWLVASCTVRCTTVPAAGGSQAEGSEFSASTCASTQWEPFDILDQGSFMFRAVPQETVSERTNECIDRRPLTGPGEEPEPQGGRPHRCP